MSSLKVGNPVFILNTYNFRNQELKETLEILMSNIFVLQMKNHNRLSYLPVIGELGQENLGSLLSTYLLN